MLDYFKNIFGKQDQRSLIKFYETESSINSILSGTDILRFNFSESQKREGEHKANLNKLIEANSDLQITDNDVASISSAQRLKRRKWFTVLIEAILAISAVKTFFLTTVNINLSGNNQAATGFAPLFWPVLLGIIIAYMVLNVAIHFRIDDSRLQASGLIVFWYKFSWILPLLLIPFLNLFNIFSDPGNPTNILWLFFAALSVFLNIKCAGYYKEFHLMTNTAIVRQKQKVDKEGIIKEQNIQARINKQMIEIKNQLMILSTEFKRLYSQFENKPPLSLNPLYCILLNNRFYYTQLLPIPEIVIMNPPAMMSDYLSFWDDRTRIEISSSDSNLEKQLNSSDHVADLPDSTSEPDPIIQAEEKTTNQQNKSNSKEDNTKAAPSFDDLLSNENEIFV